MGKKGYIKLYIGPMFSGKTTALLEDYEKYKIAGKKCLLIKHSFDIRYDTDNIMTHSKQKSTENITCRYLYQIDKCVYDYDAVFIDEIQFFEDGAIFCDKWATDNLIVIAAGLNGTFDRLEFPVITQLIPIAEEIIKKYAICRETGKKANFTFRTTNSTNLIDIGGLDKYKPVDRQTYFNSLTVDQHINYRFKLIKQFIDVYNNTNKMNINVDDDKLKQYIQSHNKLNVVDVISQFNK